MEFKTVTIKQKTMEHKTDTSLSGGKVEEKQTKEEAREHEGARERERGQEKHYRLGNMINMIDRVNV